VLIRLLIRKGSVLKAKLRIVKRLGKARAIIKARLNLKPLNPFTFKSFSLNCLAFKHYNLREMVIIKDKAR
jgi:hypothetical protein